MVRILPEDIEDLFHESFEFRYSREGGEYWWDIYEHVTDHLEWIMRKDEVMDYEMMEFILYKRIEYEWEEKAIWEKLNESLCSGNTCEGNRYWKEVLKRFGKLVNKKTLHPAYREK